MRSALLERVEKTGEHTLGRLRAAGLDLWTMEPPWADNAVGSSCIPAGAYECTRRRSPRFGLTYWLNNTDPRTFILFHSGNLARHTRGCILPGQRVGWIDRKRAVLLSRTAVRALEYCFKGESFWIEIY